MHWRLEGVDERVRLWGRKRHRGWSRSRDRWVGRVGRIERVDMAVVVVVVVVVWNRGIAIGSSRRRKDSSVGRC